MPALHSRSAARPGDRRSLASLTSVGLGLGLALFTALLVRQGVREVGAAIAVAGSGLVVVALLHVVPMLADALGWRALLRGATRPGVGTMLLARWIGESVNGLLPVMQLGGSVAKARLLARRGVPGTAAAASVVVDVTLVVCTQMLFALGGLWLLVVRVETARLAVPVAVAVGITTSALGGFVLVQRKGLFAALARLAGRVAGAAHSASLGAAALDARVGRTYRDHRAVAASGGWHLLSCLAGTGEVWLALRLLDSPVDVGAALLLESLGQLVRTGAFAVPGALGVQEGGYVLLGPLLGLTPATSLALSLTKRVRELALGVPGLIAWQLERTTDASQAADRPGRAS